MARCSVCLAVRLALRHWKLDGHNTCSFILSHLYVLPGPNLGHGIRGSCPGPRFSGAPTLSIIKNTMTQGPSTSDLVNIAHVIILAIKKVYRNALSCTTFRYISFMYFNQTK